MLCLCSLIHFSKYLSVRHFILYYNITVIPIKKQYQHFITIYFFNNIILTMNHRNFIYFTNGKDMYFFKVKINIILNNCVYCKISIYISF